MTHSPRINSTAFITESDRLDNELITSASSASKLSSHDLKTARLASESLNSNSQRDVTDTTIHNFKDLPKTLDFPKIESLKIYGDKRSKARAIATFVFICFKQLANPHRSDFARSELQLVQLKNFCFDKLKIPQLDFKVLKPLKNLEHLHIIRVPDVTSEILNSLVELNQLRSLTIENCSNIGLPALKNLGQLTNLQTLRLRFSNYEQIADQERAFQFLTSLKELQNLEISRYCPAAISQLSRCEQNKIAKLTIDKLSKNMIEQLSNWPKLEKLTVNNDGLEDELAPLLGDLKQIRSFAFFGFHNPAISFATLQSMKSLQRLKISPLQRIFKGVNTIAQLTSLKIANIAITHKGFITHQTSIFPLPKLRKVVLDSELIDKAERMNSFAGVEILKMSRVILTKEAIMELSSLSHLRKLEIKEAVFPADFDLSHLPKLDKLTSLRIDIFGGSDDRRFPTSTHRDVAKKMEDFELLGSCGLNTLEHLAQLTDLTLSGLSLDNRQMNLINSIPLLQSLDVRGCEISEQIIDDLAHQKPHLTILWPENKKESQQPTKPPSFFANLVYTIKNAFFRVFNWLGFGLRPLRD